MTRNNISRSIKSVLLLAVLVFTADRFAGYVLKKMYFNLKAGQLYMTTYLLKEAKDSVLIFGSSRAEHHYISNDLEKEWNLSTYNSGRDGRNILYSYTLYSQILARYTPKMVILDVHPNAFTWKAGESGEDIMISSLIPYIEDFPKIREGIGKVRKKDVIFSKLFKTYPYNSQFLQVILTSRHKGTKLETFKGYSPLAGSKLTPENIEERNKSLVTNDKPQENAALKQAFIDFLALSKARGVRLYVLVSPTFLPFKDNSVAEMERLAKEYGYELYDFSNLRGFDSASLYYDGTHLNHEGASRYTTFLTKYLKDKIRDTLNYPNEKLIKTASFAN